MTNVLVCIKRVPDPTGEVVLTADGSAVDGRFAGWTMSAHEEAAVEIATQVADGGTVTVLSVGLAEAEEQLRSALAVGATDAVLVETDTLGHGPADIAEEIAAVVRSREAGGTAYDLVLLGNDAADTGDFQVGVRLAYALGRPVVTGIQTIAVEGATATLKGEGPDGTEVFELGMPCVATVLEGGVSPRYPSVVGRMKAKKAPLETVAAVGASKGAGRVGLRVPPPPPSEVVVLGEGAAAAPEVVEVLKQLGVLS